MLGLRLVILIYVRNQLVDLVNLVITDLTDINISARFVLFRHRLCRVVFSQVKHLLVLQSAHEI